MREWVAVHRKHHAHTDEEGDPHSPKVHGFWKVQLGNVFLYVKEARSTATQEKYAPDFTPDAWERWVFRFWKTGLAIGIAILCLTLGLGWGLALHNNHHGAPGLAKYSRRRWEMDPAWALIRTLETLGLARDVRSRAPGSGAVGSR